MRPYLKARVVIPCVAVACSGGANRRTDALAHAAPPPALVPAKYSSNPTAAQAGSPDTAARQPPVFDSVLATLHAGQTTCYRLARYFVVERADGETGSDVLVRRRDSDAGAEPACALDSLPGDFVTRNDSTGGFAGIHGRWLFLLATDAPDGGYVVHDLATAQKALPLDGDDLVRWRDTVTVEVWMHGDTVAHARCPDVPRAMVAAIDSLVAVDLRTGAHVTSGASRCAARS